MRFEGLAVAISIQACALIAYGLMATNFTCVILYTSEALPTQFRASGQGQGSSPGRAARPCDFATGVFSARPGADPWTGYPERIWQIGVVFWDANFKTRYLLKIKTNCRGENQEKKNTVPTHFVSVSRLKTVKQN